MEYRKIKVNGETKEASLLGFGCMRLPTVGDEIDFPQARRMVMHALDNGVNYIDTAYPYHGGKSELFVKKILSELNREDVLLADKLPIWACKTQEDVDRIFHEQLEKCGTEYFDFYLIHAVNKNRIAQVKELDLFTILEKYKAEGKIRNIGFSFHDDLEAFKLWVDLYPWDFCQIQLNYMDVEHQQGMEGYDMLTERDIPVIIMEPVKGGSIAKFNDEIESLLKSERPKDSIASWAFRWVGSLPNVKVVLSGMSTMDQVQDNIKTFTNFEPITEKEAEILKEVRSKVLDLSKVDCTSCNYCMPCPHGVDIPGNFRLFNGYAMYKNDRHMKWSYGMISNAGKFADKCIECNECIPKCPQYIEIPTELANFEEYLKENGIIE